MSHGLDRIKWNNGEETMSHPLETSLTSRELAEYLTRMYNDAGLNPRFYDNAAAFIDAWVRVREAEAVKAMLSEAHSRMCNCDVMTGHFCTLLFMLRDAESAAHHGP